MKLADLVSTSADVAATRSRGRKTEALASLLARLAPDEIETAVAWLSGELRQGRIGLGPAALRDAAAGATPAAEPTLAIGDVDAAFTAIATTSGAGSGRERVRRLGALLAAATRDEQDFLFRLVVGELRQGALEGVMEEALARAAALPVDAVRRAILLSGDLPAVARAALVEGAPGLARFRLELFRPLRPMLAQPAEDVGEALGRLGEAAFEHKLDGARVQLHKQGDEVRVFSRGMNDVTVAVPELVELARALPARSAVLDGEVIALRADGAPYPFQVTMRRFGRRLDVERQRAELPLTPLFFDLLHLDGEDWIDRPGNERFAALVGTVPEANRVPRIVTGEWSEAERFFGEAIARGHEGVMAKSPDASYVAGGRGFGWLKVKAAHTLDLVVLAAEWGHGRRHGWLSNLHLGARDVANGGFVMLGKTFKGLTDAMLTWQTERLLALEIGRDEWTVHVRPELVVEIAFSDVQASPRYPAGLALRLARVKRYREDKRADAADTIDEVRRIFAAQSGVERLG